jgi:DNA-binding NarL/FixJ family response regulator
MGKAKPKGTGQIKTAKGRKAKILIVDDHPVVRRGMRGMIEEEPDLAVCGEAADATEALHLFREHKPDLMVIDISLRDGSGIELIKQIRAADTAVKMLVASMHDETTFAERVLHAGALGYVNKEEAADKIVEAIRTALAGKVFLSERMTERIMSKLAYGKPPDERAAVDTLSDRELEVFELIGKGASTRQIADRLHLSPKTVETHRESIKKKLNLRDGTELVTRAVRWVVEESG